HETDQRSPLHQSLEDHTRSKDEGAPGGTRPRARRPYARGIRRLHPHRNGEVGKGTEGRGRQARVTLSRSQVLGVTPRSRSLYFCTLPFSVRGSSCRTSI